MSKHRVILRDDDTCALTPVPYLEQLYRAFLEHGLPVNLAVIPEVSTSVRMPDGDQLEGFIRAGRDVGASSAPLAQNDELLSYLAENRGYRIAHHGFSHDAHEFASTDRADLERRLDRGLRRFEEAGMGHPSTFVAPYDQYSAEALGAIAQRFSVFSTGWFDWRRLPVGWLPAYGLKKLRGQAHWKVGGLRLLSHPGCLLSYRKDMDSMLETVQRAVRGADLTVLVTHWWEYFDNHQPNRLFIAQLHKVAEWLADDPEVEVIGLDDFAASA